MIRVVNFPFCNFFSLERYLRIRKLPFQVLESFSELSNGDTIVLPGVGTFRQGMEFLVAMNLVEPIQDHFVNTGKVIGICLGMQMLLESSAESPGVKGLGLISGGCERIPEAFTFPIPHIGWNEIQIANDKFEALSGLSDDSGLSRSDFYFVHSYYAKPLDAGVVIASFQHPSGPLAAAVAHQGCMGFQFHPEKSGSAGYRLLDRIFTL
jgi:glutamine amidotransferase